jgi:hypothetical protein
MWNWGMKKLRLHGKIVFWFLIIQKEEAGGFPPFDFCDKGVDGA